jgi:Mn-containing catalase
LRISDSKGQFEAMISKPLGQMPQLAPVRPDSDAQVERTTTNPLAGTSEAKL